jgi:hypothetical protein
MLAHEKAIERSFPLKFLVRVFLVECKRSQFTKQSIAHYDDRSECGAVGYDFDFVTGLYNGFLRRKSCDCESFVPFWH